MGENYLVAGAAGAGGLGKEKGALVDGHSRHCKLYLRQCRILGCTARTDNFFRDKIDMIILEMYFFGHEV